MSLREQGKERRREEILVAAELLIRKGGLDALSMRALGEAAEVSVTTLYNLYEGKEGVLFALMNRALDELQLDHVQAADTDPIALSRAIIESAIDRFTSDAAYYRPLVRGIHECVATPDTPRVVDRAESFFERIVRAAVARGSIEAELAPGLVARQMLDAYTHASDHWALDLLDAAGFRAQALYGLDFAWLAVAARKERARIVARLRRTEPGLKRALERRRVLLTVSPSPKAPPPSPGTTKRPRSAVGPE
jgi:AcrR family transcriptional regulator